MPDAGPAPASGGRYAGRSAASAVATIASVARVTLQTIADEVGVSRMTVSNAFNRPDQLSAAMRAKILATADRLGYTGPDPTARALVRGSSGAIGVLLTDDLAYGFRDGVATDFLAAVADELGPTGLSLTLLSSEGRDGVVPARDVAVDGVLVFSCSLDSTARDWLVKRGLPLVLVDQEPDPGFASVGIDDYHGARLAAQHLVDLGHRHVGILISGGSPGTVGRLADPRREAEGWKYVSRQRLAGFLDVLEAAGAEAVAHHVAEHGDHAAAEQAREILGANPRPTALLCYSDVLAAGALRAAEDMGLAVPDDVSVVGFDDNPLATRVRPELTTVRQDAYAKGTAAARALTEALRTAQDGEPAEPVEVVLPTELVVRESSGPAPG